MSTHQHGGEHHHHGAHDHAHPPSARGSRALVLAVVLTASYALVEVAGGLWSGSLALLADAGHMVTDAAALLFALAASVVARRPPSARHSYGLGRAEVIAAFVNALVMLAVVVWLFVESVDRLRDPRAVNGESVFLIASVGLLVNLVVAWVLARDGDNINTRAALLHVLGDLLGSVAAIAAGVIIYFTAYYPIDPLLSMLVGGLILRSTLLVLRESAQVLLDAVPRHIDFPKVGLALARIPGVRSVHDLHVWAMAPGRCALSAHVLVEDVEQWPTILGRARVLLRDEFHIEHVTLQPEWLRTPGPRRSVSIRSVS
ncbi:MAG TPA: cation diffusion facilitator family transporter [Burkholderiaceae bacterium]|nr:cation diffusion facilitator family transporter [Burkholderiaceae bacterium]